jgi:hypothetical protein
MFGKFFSKNKTPPLAMALPALTLEQQAEKTKKQYAPTKGQREDHQRHKANRMLQNLPVGFVSDNTKEKAKKYEEDRVINTKRDGWKGGKSHKKKKRKSHKKKKRKSHKNKKRKTRKTRRKTLGGVKRIKRRKRK